MALWAKLPYQIGGGELTASQNPGGRRFIWQVGVDILPGRYWTEGPKPDEVCTYQRLTGFGGSVEDWVAVGTIVGPSYVDIARSDVGFETTCIWVRVGQ